MILLVVCSSSNDDLKRPIKMPSCTLFHAFYVKNIDLCKNKNKSLPRRNVQNLKSTKAQAVKSLL